MPKYRILIVEDEALIALDLKHRLEKWGHVVLEICDTAADSITLAKELSPDLIFMDLRLRGSMSGLEAARVIQRDYPSRIIFLTANAHILEPFIQDSWFINCKVISKPAPDGDIMKTIGILFS